MLVSRRTFVKNLAAISAYFLFAPTMVMEAFAQDRKPKNDFAKKQQESPRVMLCIP